MAGGALARGGSLLPRRYQARRATPLVEPVEHVSVAEIAAHRPPAGRPWGHTRDHSEVPVEEARLDGADRRMSDDAPWLADVNARKPRGPLKEGIGGNLRAGTDDAT